MAMAIDMRQVVLLIATAVDLVGVDDVLHGRRVAILAVECARRLGWDEAVQHLMFDAGLLHDVGVSSTRVRQKLLQEDDWEDANLHCEQGSRLLQGSTHLAHLAPLVLHHHTHWEELQRRDVQPTVALYANLLFLADRIDCAAAPHYAGGSLLLHMDAIRSHIDSLRGSHFSPRLVDAFLDASRCEAFWLILHPEFIQQFIAEMQSHSDPKQIEPRDLKSIAMIIARIVDAKSHFTTEHSLGVARLTRFISRHFDLDADRCGLLEVAALMHDIGKLQVPDEVLEGPRKLSSLERAIMKKHSFATRQILRQVRGLEEIASWASDHHESLDGSGYPFHLVGEEIPLESRIIKIADIYQALAQDRPYRKALTATQILSHLKALQAEQELDQLLVNFVADHLDGCHRAAVGF